VIPQEIEIIARRGKPGQDGVSIRGTRGAPGKAFVIHQEGDTNVTTRSAPSIRGRQEMVLQQGDTHLARITKVREIKQSVVNHTDTQLLQVTRNERNTRNENLHFHEGPHTSVRNSVVNRRTQNNFEVYAPITAYRKPAIKRSVITLIDVYAPVIIQRIKQVTRINRTAIFFSPAF